MKIVNIDFLIVRGRAVGGVSRAQSPRVQPTLPSPVRSRERDIAGQRRLGEVSERQAARQRDSRERSQPRGHERPSWGQETSEVQRPVRPGPPVVQLQMIDRTVEEFGEDWDEVTQYTTQYTQYRLQYTSTARDHTSQYTMGQEAPLCLSQLTAPPPAHEDSASVPPSMLPWREPSLASSECNQKNTFTIQSASDRVMPVSGR